MSAAPCGIRRLGVLLLTSLLVLAGPARAHKASDAYLQLQVNGHIVTERIDIALRDLDRDLVLDADDNGELRWDEVRHRWRDIESLAQQGALILADGQPCKAGHADAPQLDEHSDGRYAVVVRSWTCPSAIQALEVSYGLFASTDPTHRGVARLQRGTLQETAVLVPGASPHRFASIERSTEDAAPSGFTGFLAEGVHHILIGTDHLLFLLALLLPAVLLRRSTAEDPLGWAPAPTFAPVLADVLRVVTAFTVAHSITLALAAFDVVDPPSRWVESAIAASVLLAALNNLFPFIGKGRWKLTFAFGLVHGFGFAGALRDLGLHQGDLALPLLAFNLGVELGQLAILAAFMVLMWRLRRLRAYPTWVLGAGSVTIALMACAWLAERALDLRWHGPFS